MEEKPDIAHLRIFGSRCFYKIQDEKRKKLDDKSKNGILLGHESKSRIYDIEKRTIIRSRDVMVLDGDTINKIDEDDEEVIVSKGDDEEVVIHKETVLLAWDGSPTTYLEAREDENNRKPWRTNTIV